MKSIMEINKETALRLWNQQFGKKQKAFDFSGREIAKAAYNARDSKFGWNIDHILPQSRGGKTADYNLICCHILTNDEKSDRFPAFKANEKQFEIRKKQNHYEIIERSNNYLKQSTQNITNNNDDINFFDVSSGLKYWNKCNKTYTSVYVGYVKIKVKLYEYNDDLLDSLLLFFEKILEPVSISRVERNSYSRTTFNFTFIKGKSNNKSSAQNLLDSCILLNTYSSFIENINNCKINIFCGMKNYDSILEAGEKLQYEISNEHIDFSDSLTIDSFIKDHTNAKNEIQEPNNSFWYSSSNKNEYNFNIIFKKLQKDLNKKLDIYSNE